MYLLPQTIQLFNECIQIHRIHIHRTDIYIHVQLNMIYNKFYIIHRATQKQTINIYIWCYWAAVLYILLRVKLSNFHLMSSNSCCLNSHIFRRICATFFIFLLSSNMYSYRTPLVTISGMNPIKTGHSNRCCCDETAEEQSSHSMLFSYCLLKFSFTVYICVLNLNKCFASDDVNFEFIKY